MTFAKPLWLFLLILIPLMGTMAGVAWHRRGARWKRLLASRLRGRLSHTRPSWIYFVSLGLGLLGLAGLIVAVAQPEAGEEWIQSKNEGRNILLCVDISRSMLAQDVSPNRLLAARAAALDVVERFENDRIGLLVFSGESQVQVPLTIDHSFVEQSLAQMNPVDLPLGGSNLAEAIKAGTRTLLDTGQRSNVLVLFSDGEEFSPGLEDAAAAAADSGIFIYALGFGTTKGTMIPGNRQGKPFLDKFGNQVISRLNEEPLIAVAKKTDGFYSQGIGQSFLKRLDSAMAEMDRFEEEGRHQRIAKPAYKWFLFSGLILLMTSFGLRCFPLRSAAMVAFFMLGFSPELQANALSEGKAALRDGNKMRAHALFTEAAESSSGERAARLHLAAGSAAFEAGSWNSAASSFSEALISDNPEIKGQAHYSLGTCLYYLGVKQDEESQKKAWAGAVEHFEQALEINPDDERAEENLEIVKSLIKPDPPQEEEEKKDQKQDEKKQDKQQEDDKKDDEQSKSEEEEKSEEPKDGEEKKEDENKGEQKSEPENPEEKDDPKEEAMPEPKEEDEDGTPDESKKDPEAQEGQSDQKEDSKNGDSEKEGQEKEDEQAKQEQAGEESKEEPKEDPKERARRILRQHADFGGKAPKYRKRPLRRPAKDW